MECIVSPTNPFNCTEIDYIIRYRKLELLFEQVTGLERYFRQLYQRAYHSLQQRLCSTISINAEERYKLLIINFPQIAAGIPFDLYRFILGITYESLSRIRKQLFH